MKRRKRTKKDKQSSSNNPKGQTAPNFYLFGVMSVSLSFFLILRPKHFEELYSKLQFYVFRKANLLKQMRREQVILSNKARFFEEGCNEELIVSNRKRADILSNLKEADYDIFPKEKKDKIRYDETNEYY